MDFEIYQQHGSTTTRNTFAVYANTGGGGAQELQFSIRGDGCVTKPKSPAFSANLAGSDLNAATHNNVIVFNNEHFDKSGSYDTSNGRFTAPVAGLYYFGVQIYAGFGFKWCSSAALKICKKWKRRCISRYVWWCFRSWWNFLPPNRMWTFSYRISSQ